MIKTLSQRKFVKGLDASHPVQAQEPGALPRLSNLVFTRRGGLVTVDGSSQIGLLSPVAQNLVGPITAIAAYFPNAKQGYYLALTVIGAAMAGPTNVTITGQNNGGGVLVPGNTFAYRVSAVDGNGNETAATGEVSQVLGGGNNSNLVAWTAASPITGVISYNIYGRTVGAEKLIGNVPVGTNSFTDLGTVAPSGQPPLNNITQLTNLGKFQSSFTSITNLQTTNIPALPTLVGGIQGNNFLGQSTLVNSPNGGVANELGPVPQIVQFANKMIFALGNGVVPQQFDDGTQLLTALTNTTTPMYPDWVANQNIPLSGYTILPTVGNAGAFVFKTIGNPNGNGLTGGVHPTWPQTQGSTVTDNAVTWQNTGVTGAAPLAPRGAAHAVAYAGSLWLLNTSPTTTTDNFDGPTCLKMSDLNNPNSWNPLNVAFIGKDDGTQGMGMTPFSIAADGVTPTGSLVVFKEFSTYQVIGVFGASNFAIQQAQTDLGCIAPRSIQFLPGFGVARLTHLGVAIFDGIRDRLISEEVRPYIFSQPWESDILPIDFSYAYMAKGTQTSDPPMYVLSVPVLLKSISGVSVSTTAVASTLTNDPRWFVRVSEFVLVNGVKKELAITTEFGPFNIPNASTGLLVNVANATPSVNHLWWRVYYGIGTKLENNILDILPGTTSLTITAASARLTNQMPNGIGGMNRIMCYDLVLKAWTIVDLPWSITSLTQVRAPGSPPITVSGDAGAKAGAIEITGNFNPGSPGQIRRMFGDDTLFDGAIAVPWNVRTPEVFGKNTDERVYYRRLTMRGSYRGTQPTITATVTVQGAAGVARNMRIFNTGTLGAETQFTAMLDLGFNSLNTHIDISGSGLVEINGFDWEVVPMTAGVPVSVQ